MYPYGSAFQSTRTQKSNQASKELRVAITFRRAGGEPGLTKFAPPLSTASVQRFVPDPLQMDHAIYELSKLGFTPTRRGRLSVSMRCSKEVYEKCFATVLNQVNLDPKVNYSCSSVYFPPEDAPWSPIGGLGSLIDDAYIQWPHIYMAQRPRPVRRTRKAAGGAKRLIKQALSGPEGSPSATP